MTARRRLGSSVLVVGLNVSWSKPTSSTSLSVSWKSRSVSPGSAHGSCTSTVAPYSLRARAEPTVSTPVSWDEVLAGRYSDLAHLTTIDILGAPTGGAPRAGAADAVRDR